MHLMMCFGEQLTLQTLSVGVCVCNASPKASCSLPRGGLMLTGGSLLSTTLLWTLVTRCQ